MKDYPIINENRFDIKNEADIKLLVDTFYDKVNADPLLSPIFNEVAKVHWEKHLPVMYDFWSSLLLGTGRYHGNPFLKHIPLPVSQDHFGNWISLFCQTVDALYAGPVANEAKARGQNIARIFQARLLGINMVGIS